MRRPLILLLVLILGCQTAAPPATREAVTEPTPARSVQTVRSNAGLVVSDSPIASAVGADILRRGGNAVDAAIATAFALAVTWPEAGNIGGGGFMLIAGPDIQPVAIDYREAAPAAATADMYTPGENRHRPRHVGVPGTVEGLGLAYARFNSVSMPWPVLIEPAIKLARDGFEIDAALADSLNGVLNDPETHNSPELAEFRRVFGHPDGREWRAGDRLVQPDLARTLEEISTGDGFYRGRIANELAAFMEEHDGLITADDLARYSAQERQPTRTAAFDHDVLGMPPPSSGGVCVGLILQQCEALGIGGRDGFDATAIHLIAESMRRAFHQRALYLGDADFARVPLNTLTGEALPRILAESIDPERATPSESLEPAIPLADESPSTTHFSVIDANGMAVANTYTLEQSWGSRVIVPGLGFVLNNEMGDFNWTPGRTTRGGAIGTEANIIEPYKRPLSSMSPTLVMKDGRVVGITGSPGGRTIISTTALILLNVLAFDLSPESAVEMPRFHHQWLPDVIVLERPAGIIDWPVPDLLEAMGHAVDVRDTPQGSAHTIWWDADAASYVGIADFRRGGAAVAATDSAAGP